MYPNPLIPGFNPDPSVVKVGGDYYLATSTFEYLPGIPIYHSIDLVEWTQIGNVVTRPEQAELDTVPTLGGVWAPTIRYRDGTFYLIITIAMTRGCVLFTATDPAGPWSDGLVISGVGGIDPDLAWDDDGTAYVTYSGLVTTGPDAGTHAGIQQVRIDLATGTTLEQPRSLWSGTGLKFPEAPHLYHRGGFWYLMIAEGGTERGHSVSIARGEHPDGPFEGAPGNPLLSARSTSRPIQNTGHGDLVETPDGSTAMVLLGMRPRGLTQSFSALGRETFITDVIWVDGWPVVEPVELRPLHERVAYRIDFGADAPLDAGWMGVRALPAALSSLTERPGWLTIEGDGSTLGDLHPRFVGRRQITQTATVRVRIDAAGGAGGLALRYDEDHYVSVELDASGRAPRVIARAQLAGIAQVWEAPVDEGVAELSIEMRPPAGGMGPAGLTSDIITLRARTLGSDATLAEVDGRYFTAETSASFTGRVIGLYATVGHPSFESFSYEGSEE